MAVVCSMSASTNFLSAASLRRSNRRRLNYAKLFVNGGKARKQKFMRMLLANPLVTHFAGFFGATNSL